MSNASDFIIENGVLTKYVGPGGDVVIPDGVTSIGVSAFCKCTSLTSVTIPDSVTSIGSAAFYYCQKLQSVNIPNEVTHIGNRAFEECQSLNSITIPEKVSSIGEKAFSFCESLMSITIPEGVTTIKRQSFWYCSNLQTIKLPESLEFVGDDAFESCISLVSIELPEKVSSIGTQVFCGCKNLKTVRFNGKLKKIDARTFYACDKLQEIIAPHSLFEVFKQAKLQVFAATGYLGCSEEYTDTQIIADYQKYIGSQKKKLLPLVFAQDMVQGMEAYAKVNKITAQNVDEDFLIPAQAAEANQCVAFLLEWKNKNISEDISVKDFAQDSKKDPFNVADMKKWWSYIKLADGTLEVTGYKGDDVDIVLPERIGKAQVSSIGNMAFSPHAPGRITAQRKINEMLHSVIIPEGITRIGIDAFYGCKKLAEITIPSSVQHIGCAAFRDCESIISIAIPEKVKYIKDETFMNCESLQNVVFPPKLKRIGVNAFSNCRSLVNVSIPDSVTDLGPCAFEACHSLQKIELPDALTTLAQGLFGFCSSLTSIRIPERVTTIEDSVFSYCSALTGISIPKGVSSLGARVFKECKKLADGNGFVIINNTLYDYFGDDICVKIPVGVEIIDESVFKYHRNIVQVVLPDGLQYIGEEAFAECNIEEIAIPQSVRKIALRGFAECKYLKKVIVQNTTTIDGAFNGCDLLADENGMIVINGVLVHSGIRKEKKIIIPDGAKRIGAAALWRCSGMEELVIPESVEKIEGSLCYEKRRTVVVIGKAGSYAETYAKENNIPFVAE